MDGTLIDSAEYHWITWRDTLAELGFALTREIFRGWFGSRNDRILRRYFADIARRRGAARRRLKEARYRALVREDGIELLPGVGDVAGAAPRGRLAAGGGLVGAAGEHRRADRGARTRRHPAGGRVGRGSAARQAGSRRLPARRREARRRPGTLRGGRGCRRRCRGRPSRRHAHDRRSPDRTGPSTPMSSSPRWPTFRRTRSTVSSLPTDCV